MSKKLTIPEIIKRANKKHNNFYDYSLFKIYVNNKGKMPIKCYIHGEFSQFLSNHLRGAGCPKCVNEKRKENLTKSPEQFEKEANKLYNNFYKYYNDYINVCTKVKITCPIHGVFKQRPNSHLQGQGCRKCGFEKLTGRISKTLEEFEKEANIEHNNFYDYSESDYKGNKIKLIIICRNHGKFLQTPDSHLRGRGCPKCKSSKGEKKIRNYLKENNIEFKEQKRFKECRNIKPLPFDFYLPNYNICIEFQGNQHFKEVEYWGGREAFKKRRFLDSIKKSYCINNNIKLLEISYKDFNNIETIIKGIL